MTKDFGYTLLDMMFDRSPIEEFEKLWRPGEDLLSWGELLLFCECEESYLSVGGDEGNSETPMIDHESLERLGKLIAFIEGKGVTHQLASLLRKISKIDALYISKRFLERINEQSCDCDEIVIECDGAHVLLTSEAVGEDGRILFKEDISFDKAQYPYEVELENQRFVFDKFCHLENGMIDGIRFAADGVFLFIFALEHNLVLTMSKYDLFCETEMELPEKEATLTIAKR